VKALRRFLNRLFASATSRRDEARPREEVEVHLQTQARSGACRCQRRGARRRAVGGPATRRWRSGSPLVPDVHASTVSF
jgi:hypothetical protein